MNGFAYFGAIPKGAANLFINYCLTLKFYHHGTQNSTYCKSLGLK